MKLALRIWSKAQLLWEFPRDENRRGRELVITHLRQAERRELSAYERKVGGDVNCDSHASKVSVDSLHSHGTQITHASGTGRFRAEYNVKVDRDTGVQ